MFMLITTIGVYVYAGNGLYRLDSDEGGWPVDEFGLQVDISRSLRNLSSLGNCQYSAKYILNDVKGIYLIDFISLSYTDTLFKNILN